MPDSLARSGGTVIGSGLRFEVSGALKLRIALSVLPVVLIAVWLNLISDDSFNLPINAIWAIVTFIGVGICVLLGRAAGASNATLLWISCLLASLLLAGFCALAILGIGMVIAPLAIVLITFSLVNLTADFR